MKARKKNPPVTFERVGKSYLGYATAIRTGAGTEVIILAATIDEAERMAGLVGNCILNRDLIQRAALVSEKAFYAMTGAEAKP